MASFSDGVRFKRCLEDLSRASSEELEATTTGRECKQEGENNGIMQSEKHVEYQHIIQKGTLVLGEETVQAILEYAERDGKHCSGHEFDVGMLADLSVRLADSDTGTNVYKSLPACFYFFLLIKLVIFQGDPWGWCGDVNDLRELF
jgi:hypothetical protein